MGGGGGTGGGDGWGLAGWFWGGGLGEALGKDYRTTYERLEFGSGVFELDMVGIIARFPTAV